MKLIRNGVTLIVDDQATVDRLIRAGYTLVEEVAAEDPEQAAEEPAEKPKRSRK